MAKTRRGKVLWNRPGRSRGTCPLCGRTRIKLLYERTINGARQTVCKVCR